MAKPTVLKWDTGKDGQLNEENMRKKLEALGYHVSRYVYSPGTVFPEHDHDEDKIDGVLTGKFEMTLLGQTIVLGPGDALQVPKGVSHIAKVIGNESVVSLDATK